MRTGKKVAKGKSTRGESKTGDEKKDVVRKNRRLLVRGRGEQGSNRRAREKEAVKTK